MWKKDDVPAQAAEPRAQQTPQPERAANPTASRERATIGRSITIKGEVTGDEDLLIQGRVDGSVDLKQHAVTVGPEGEVKANIRGRIVTVEGKVEGNINADEQIILRASARVVGDIAASRIVLEDGAQFRGGVDMGDTAERRRSAGAAAQQPRKGHEATRAPTEPVASSSGSVERSSESETGAEDPGARVTP